jgi:hypothetical protein
VLGSGEQMWRSLGPQYFLGMRIECHDDRSAVDGSGVISGRGNNRLMAAVNPVENADGEEKRPAQLSEIGNGVQYLHHLNDE